MYIPQSCTSGTYLAVSADEGASYSWRLVGGAPSANGLGAVVQLAIDRAGNLYLLWSEADALRLIVSRDGGRNWGSPLAISAPGLHHITLPGLAAGSRGAVGIVYYASTDPAAEVLSGYVSQTADALARRPLFFAGAINDPAHPIFKELRQRLQPSGRFRRRFVRRRGHVLGRAREAARHAKRSEYDRHGRLRRTLGALAERRPRERRPRRAADERSSCAAGSPVAR